MSSWYRSFTQHRELSNETLLDERIRLEHTQTSIGVVGATLTASFIYWTYPAEYRGTQLAASWLLLQCTLLVIWFVFMFILSSNRSALRRYWPYISTAASSLYGLAWSLGWLIFAEVPHQTVHATLYVISFVGVVSGGFFATAFHLPSMLSFVSMSVLPIVFNALLFGSIIHPLLTVAIMIYALAFCAFTLNWHWFLLDALVRREREVILTKTLEEEKKQTELARQDKNRFLAAASHDLRQPLQAIHFFQYALEKQLPAERDWGIFRKMQESTQSLTELLDALLDISKLDAGGIEIKRQPLFLHDLLHRVYQRYFPLAANTGIDLDYVPVRIWVDSDPKALERIVQNLVVNAIKHMGKQGRIVLGARRYAGGVRVEVHDNGVGISSADQAAIFTEFYQINNPERNRNKGLGLGLSIVKRLAGLLEHDVGLVSQKGRGCTFSITLPLTSVMTLPVVASNQMDTTSSVTPIQGQVLLVEDDKTVLDALVLLFRLWGYSTVTAKTLDAATILQEHHDIQMIVSDYQLQEGHDGLQLIQELRLLSGWEIPAILITGNTSPDVLKMIAPSGIALSYKPINPHVLHNLAQKVMHVC